MRRGPLLGVFVFLACTYGGYKLGVMRREARLRRAQDAAARFAAQAASPEPAVEPVAISTQALSGELPTDLPRVESVPRVLE